MPGGNCAVGHMRPEKSSIASARAAIYNNLYCIIMVYRGKLVYKSYAERLLSFPPIGALSESDSAQALEEPTRAAGVLFDAAAMREVFRLTKGYPYFVQEWGYQIWKAASKSPITKSIVDAATQAAIPRLDENFFRVRFDRLTPSEKNFLRAMADSGPRFARTGDIAEKLNLKINRLGPVRASLIKKGMIYSPAHGDLAFTVPLFDEFMKRAMNPDGPINQG